MAKINISLNEKKYEVYDENFLNTASVIKSHLSTTMSGTGEVVNFGGKRYDVDSTKLATARDSFVARLVDIAGTGKKIIVNGVEYEVGSAKLANATVELENVLAAASKLNPSEGLTYHSNGNGTCSVNQGNCTDTYIIIPETSPSGDKVTSIEIEGFWGGPSWPVNVMIPSTVTSIGNDAFWECSELTSIIYNGTVARWQAISKGDYWDADTGDYTVYCWDGEISKDGSITHKDYASEGLVFRSNGDGTCRVGGIGTCTDIDIFIPTASPTGDIVTSIGDSAFYFGTGFESVVIPNSVTSIARSAFYGCDSLTSVVIPDSVTNIDTNAFGECYDLSSVHYNGTVAQWLAIPKDIDQPTGTAWDYDTNEYTVYCSDGEITKRGVVTYYPSTASEGLQYYQDNQYFSGSRVYSIGTCTDTDIIISNEHNGLTVTGINDSTFRGCTSLTSIVIPNSVTIIGDEAFFGCTGLTSIVIPDSVKSIGDWAFWNCTGLTSIVIGKGITYFYENTFDNCDNLTNIFYTGTVEQWEEISNTPERAGIIVCCSDGYIRI